MTETKPYRMYLVHVVLRDKTPARLMEAVSAVRTVLENLSRKDMYDAYACPSLAFFGTFVRTQRVAPEIVAALHHPGIRAAYQVSALRTGDKVFVAAMDDGGDAAQIDMSEHVRWLTRYAKPTP